MPEGGVDIAGVKEGELVSVLDGAIGASCALHLSYRAVLRADPRVLKLIDMLEHFVATRAEDIGHDEVFGSSTHMEPDAGEA